MKPIMCNTYEVEHVQHKKLSMFNTQIFTDRAATRRQRSKNRENNHEHDRNFIRLPSCHTRKEPVRLQSKGLGIVAAVHQGSDDVANGNDNTASTGNQLP